MPNERESRPKAGIGDSGDEHLEMPRGSYSAWLHVLLAFIIQMLLAGSLFSKASELIAQQTKASDGLTTGLAIIFGVSTTLLIYWDRWRCIEAFSSRFCSGVSFFSLMYVPWIALVYANYRGFRKLRERDGLTMS